MASSAIRWDPPTISGQYANLPVTDLYAIAHFPVLKRSSDIFAPPSDKQTNHWTLSFRVGEASSIRVDPSLGNGNRLDLELSVKNHVFTDRMARYFGFQPNGLTTKKFLECIIEARYDQYKFTPSGQGCRHWVARVLELLANKGFLHGDAAAFDATNVAWDENGNPVPDAVQTIAEKGAFL